jgi:hypothetical protein
MDDYLEPVVAVVCFTLGILFAHLIHIGMIP